jgi:anti-sigma regulatory factor (Ser/Thr protein kinase)
VSNLDSSNGAVANGRRELHRRFTAEVASARTARRELHTLARYLDNAELQIAALLTSELVSNSVKHSGTAPAGVVDLDVALDRRLLRVEVRDDGPGFEPRPRAPGSPDEAQWGLHLVAGFADRWGVAPQGTDNTVWFELDR